MDKVDTLNELWTVNDVAQDWHVSPDTVRRYGDTGQIPMLRTRSGVRLFRYGDVLAFKEQRQAATRIPAHAAG